MEIMKTAQDMQRWALEQRKLDMRIAFVPTMGYLHEGHLALMLDGRTRCECLVASIFVNPMQFNNPEDFGSYPMDLEGDLDKCAKSGCDAVFLPDAKEIYPEGFTTRIEVEDLARPLCGKNRPGHFDGVATVCAKLFNIVQPHVAVFGEKDYQQLAIIRRMVRDLNFPMDIIGYPTVREPDGLAMSSRNARLTSDERRRATVLYQALTNARERVEAGENAPGRLIEEVRNAILAAGPNTIDYVDIVDANTLEDVADLQRPAVMALAVHFGSSRLIDNIVLNG